MMSWLILIDDVWWYDGLNMIDDDDISHDYTFELMGDRRGAIINIELDPALPFLHLQPLIFFSLFSFSSSVSLHSPSAIFFGMGLNSEGS